MIFFSLFKLKICDARGRILLRIVDLPMLEKLEPGRSGVDYINKFSALDSVYKVTLSRRIIQSWPDCLDCHEARKILVLKSSQRRIALFLSL